MTILELLKYFFVLLIAIALMLLAVAIIRNIFARKKGRVVHRGLFVYSDGKNTRSIDPIAAILALEAHPEFRFDRHPALAREGDSESVRIVADAVRRVFSVPEYSAPGKPGLTITECQRLLGAFALYVDSQKKSTNLSATAAPSTGPTPAPSTKPTTSDSSPSGSIADALA